MHNTVECMYCKNEWVYLYLAPGICRHCHQRCCFPYNYSGNILYVLSLSIIHLRWHLSENIHFTEQILRCIATVYLQNKRFDCMA